MAKQRLRDHNVRHHSTLILLENARDAAGLDKRARREFVENGEEEVFADVVGRGVHGAVSGGSLDRAELQRCGRSAGPVEAKSKISSSSIGLTPH